MSEIAVTPGGIAWSDLSRIAAGEPTQLALTEPARDAIRAGRGRIEAILAEGQTIYGINTGFGKLASKRISSDQLTTLQHNLLFSHAAGLGAPLSDVLTRLSLALRIATLSHGNSGIRLQTVERLIALFNLDLLPVVPEQGSVGACGDLAPLAHLALPVIGHGELRQEGQVRPAADALAEAGLTPLSLEAKEGLALINGTQVSTAQLVSVLHRAERLVKVADIAGAMSLEALQGTDRAFDARVDALRPHPGAGSVATNLRGLIADSAIRQSHADCDRVQDPYSIRCMPQVHGASRDALRHVLEVCRIETRAVTDNPLVMEDGAVISAGNFHGQPIALAADYAAIALAELANISACRIEQLVNPDLSRLPPFLVEGEGLNSGYMIAHVAAVSLVSENKVLAHPASVDSIPTSAEQEDHVSMSTFASRKCATVATNLEQVLAIELLLGAQGIDFHLPLQPGPGLAAAHALIRSRVPHLDRDRLLSVDINALIDLVRSGELLDSVTEHTALVGLDG